MLVTLLAFSFISFAGGRLRDRKDIDLVIRRSILTKECSFISSQPCRTKLVNDALECTYSHQQPAPKSWRQIGEEEMAIYPALDENSLWLLAESICGIDINSNCSNIVDNTPGFDSGSLQEVLSHSKRATIEDDAIANGESPPLDIESLHISGLSSNRVNLVFFSDGYMSEEQSKFMDDAARLAQDIIGNQTFSTVKPLLNIWAAFSPSNESGIGIGGIPKETPFGLYRDGTELRAVYYSKPEAARAACDFMGDRCDYPILLENPDFGWTGNDPYYGGLGGEYTVITSSLANGPLVLRHELGHSIIDVGEEYDGGFAYYGPNSASDLDSPLPWSHWLSSPPEEPPKIERSVMPFQTYPWTLLNASTPWSITFESSGLYFRHLIRFSLSGLPDPMDLRVELDGINLEWVPKQGIGKDRWHYDIYRDGGLIGGDHEVTFTLLNKDLEGEAQLCSVEGLEFGNEAEFTDTPGYYGIFPTFSETNETTYRPTNEDCLMRDVKKVDFCKVCMEGLWLSLLKQVNLLEEVREGCQWLFEPKWPFGRWQKTLDIILVPLAQFREHSTDTTESYTIIWRKESKILPEFTNKTRILLDDDISLGTYNIEVKFATEEVRLDSDGLLNTIREYTVEKKCSRCNL